MLHTSLKLILIICFSALKPHSPFSPSSSSTCQTETVIIHIQSYSTGPDVELVSNLLKAAQGCFRIIFFEGFGVVILILQINIRFRVAVLRVFLKWKQTNSMWNLTSLCLKKHLVQINGAWLWQLHNNSYVNIIHNCTSYIRNNLCNSKLKSDIMQFHNKQLLSCNFSQLHMSLQVTSR